MAPSPILNIEPKGPDKNGEKYVENVSSKDKPSASKREGGSSSKEKASVESLSFSEIEEKELRLLLDEAYSYKSPKDRAGKSVLFQELLDKVEENDACKTKPSDRGKEFGISGLKGSRALENGHDAVCDKAVINNILGVSDKEKKKRKHKRDGSSTGNGSRKPKFSQTLKINQGPQSSAAYNGNNSVQYHSSSRSLSRAQQSLSARLSNAKPAALLTSSSNIDKPMVTTYNKQPIMTPALVPSTQPKATEVLVLDTRDRKVACTIGTEEMLPKNTNGQCEEIEMKVLDRNSPNDSVFKYTAHASLEIGASSSASPSHKQTEESDKFKSKDDSSALFPLQSSITLMNGTAENSIQNSIIYKPLDGDPDEKEDTENVSNADSSKGASVPGPAPPSVDDAKAVDSLLQQTNAQNTATTTANPTFKFQSEPAYSLPWAAVPGFIVTVAGDSPATLRGNMCTKDTLESRRSYDENATAYSPNYSSFISNTSTSMSRDRSDNGSDRKHKIRKAKKPNSTSILSEDIEGHCGNKSLTDLLEYIENSNTPGAATKNVKSKPTTAVAKGGEKQKNKASTDEDIRNRKPPKMKERLNKSTSLEDLRHNKSKPNKKQSSVDDSQYAVKESQPPAAAVATATTLPDDFQPPLDDESRLYFDSAFDDDNYTETEFHLVTKKQRKKKRRSKSRTSEPKADGERSSNFLSRGYSDRNESGGGFKRSPRSSENRHRSRRKSVSSAQPDKPISDTDSIHSLPVSSTTAKCKVKKKSTSSGCTPQASYADIAKSPQCQSSTALNGDPTTAAAKWQMKNFSTSPSSTAVSSNSSASSSNTGDVADPSDTPELVSSAKCEDHHVELDDSCDQLLLTNSNSISDSCTGSNSLVVHNVDEVKSNNSININNNNNSSSGSNNISDCNDITRVDVTLRRKSKPTDRRSDNDNNNNSHTCCSGKYDKEKEDANANPNLAGGKGKRAKNKKKSSVEESETVDNLRGSGSGKTTDGKGNDLFVEFTLKCAPAVTTRCSQTQTDSVEVNNNACGNDVTVEETVVVKCSRNAGARAAVGDDGPSKVNKLSHSLPVDETGSKVVVLANSTNSEVNIGFTVDEDLLDKAGATNQKQLEMLRQTRERGSKYNVNEVVQYVSKSWNEVMKSLSSAKLGNTNSKIQYYNPK